MISRDTYLQKIIDYMHDGQIKVITGIRRCGKSTLLFEIFYDYLLKKGIRAENIIRIQLDKRVHAKFRNPILLANYIHELLSKTSEQFYLLIDEIQFCYSVADPDNQGFEITVYDMLNELKDYNNLDVYVTGSNSKMLSKDISTEFRGRSSQIHVFPLSFSEYNEALHGDTHDNFERFMLYGGMPYLLHLKNESQYKQYLLSLFDEVYIKDIMERNKIERTDILEDILNVLSSQVSSLTNPLNITNTIKSVKKEKLSSNTVSDYIGYCKDAFLINEAKRYDVKGKQYFEYPNKYYFTDIGLRNARLSFRQFDKGHIMENIIYNELLIRGYSVDVGVVVDRTKRQNIQKEIDFIVNDADKKIYIQSALRMDDDKKISSELNSLLLAKDFFKKIIIRMDISHNFYDENGIFHCNLLDFLLKKIELF